MRSLLLALNMVVLLLFLALPSQVLSQSLTHCESCLLEVVSKESEVLSSYDGTFKRRICYHCMKYAAQCFVCKLPARANSKLADDKRLFCNRDFDAAIFSYNEMDRLTYRTTMDMNRVFWRFNMNFAATNVTVALVSSATLYDLLGERFNPQNAGTVGITITRCFDGENKAVKLSERHKEPAGTQFRYEHEIYVANGFPEEKLRAILAHELAHVWLHENLPFERANAIDRHTIEGFCELVAYHLVEQENVVNVIGDIRNNLYTMGQQNILIEVESGYGFHRILQWFYKGTGRRLQNADLVRQINESPVPTSKPNNQTSVAAKAETPSTEAPPAGPKPIALPETVLLKGIFYGKNKSALVNNVTLSEGEEQMVKLAVGLTGVKCLEIKSSSAILVVNGETKEYFVGRPPVDVVSGESK